MRKEILIVEDDHAIRTALHELLEMEGFDVKAAENGQDALDQLRTQVAQPSVVLLDMMMPVMDGSQFLTHVSADEELQHLKVVVLSAGGVFPSKGAVACLRKPTDVDTLIQTLRRHCN